jgi:hypothetical protein
VDFPGEADAVLAVIGFEQFVAAQAQQFGNEVPILGRILNDQNPLHARVKCNIFYATRVYGSC